MTTSSPPRDRGTSGSRPDLDQSRSVPVDSDGYADPGDVSLKEFVVQAGLEVLDRDGLSLGVDSISYAKVFAYLEQQYSIRITRASVHERIWSSLEDFQHDILAEAVECFPTIVTPEAVVFRSALDRIAESDLDSSARMAEYARYVGPRIFSLNLKESSSYQIQLTKAMAFSIDDEFTARTLKNLIKQRVEGLLSLRSQRFATVTADLGVRTKPSLGLGAEAARDLFYTMAISLFHGSLLNHQTGCGRVASAIPFMDVSPEDDEPWTMLSIGLKSFFDFLFEDGREGVEAVNPLPTPESTTTRTPLQVEARDQSSSSRRSREQLRRLVLAAGVELLLGESLQLRPESLSYATVFAHIKQKYDMVVHRASVHNRHWSSNKEYWLDVLTRGVEVDGDLTPAIMHLLEAYPDVMHPVDLNGRRQAAMDSLRVVTTYETEELLSSPSFLRHQSIKAALLNQPESAATEELRRALYETQLTAIDRYSTAIREHILGLGFEVRPELGIDESAALRIMTLLAVTTATGAIFDQSAGVDAANRAFRFPRVDGSDDFNDWTPTSVATWAFFDQVFQETNSD